MDFVAIDFETACGKRNSACAVGLVKSINGAIEDELEIYICPPELEFSKFASKVHGITADLVCDKPTINVVWPEIQSFIGEYPLVAHNARFDFHVLRESLANYSIEMSDNFYGAFTLEMAKNLLPGLSDIPGLNNYKLNTIAHLFGVKFKHHDALEDTKTVANIANLFWGLAGEGKFSTYFRKLSYYMPNRGFDPEYDMYIQIRLGESNSGYDVGEEIEFIGSFPANSLPSDNRFSEKTFVFTGTLQTLSRSEAEQIVMCLGGQCKGAPSNGTDFVVLGSDFWVPYTRGEYVSGKVKKAVEVKKKGFGIRIIDEKSFLDLLK